MLVYFETENGGDNCGFGRWKRIGMMEATSTYVLYIDNNRARPRIDQPWSLMTSNDPRESGNEPVQSVRAGNTVRSRFKRQRAESMPRVNKPSRGMSASEQFAMKRCCRRLHV